MKRESGTNFDNGAVKVQVQVASPLKLVAFVNGNQVANGGGSPIQIPPSDYVTNSSFGLQLVGNQQQPQSVQLGCVDKITGQPQSGCQFQIQPLELGKADAYSNGGHGEHDGNRPFILGSTEPGFKYDGAIHAVDSEGQSLQYWPPIIAGDVVVKIKGFDPQGNPIDDAPPITFRVKTPDLVQLSGDSYTFKCTIDPTNEACPFSSYEHSDFYRVTSDVNSRMSKIGTQYVNESDNDRNPLIVTDASLAWGGVYDWKAYLSDASAWIPPHKYHRQGTDIDVNRPTITDPDTFEKIVCRNGGFPDAENSAHYHLYFYIYGGTPTFVNLLVNVCKVAP